MLSTILLPGSSGRTSPLPRRAPFAKEKLSLPRLRANLPREDSFQGEGPFAKAELPSPRLRANLSGEDSCLHLSESQFTYAKKHRAETRKSQFSTLKQPLNPPKGRK